MKIKYLIIVLLIFQNILADEIEQIIKVTPKLFGATINFGLPYLAGIDGKINLRKLNYKIYPSLEGEISLIFGEICGYVGINYLNINDVNYQLLLGYGYTTVFGTEPKEYDKLSAKIAREKYFKNSKYFGYKINIGIEYWTEKDIGNNSTKESVISPRLSYGIFIAAF